MPLQLLHSAFIIHNCPDSITPPPNPRFHRETNFKLFFPAQTLVPKAQPEISPTRRVKFRTKRQSVLNGWRSAAVPGRCNIQTAERPNQSNDVMSIDVAADVSERAVSQTSRSNVQTAETVVSRTVPASHNQRRRCKMCVAAHLKCPSGSDPRPGAAYKRPDATKHMAVVGQASCPSPIFLTVQMETACGFSPISYFTMPQT
jgi:hypothetical protein